MGVLQLQVSEAKSAVNSFCKCVEFSWQTGDYSLLFASSRLSLGSRAEVQHRLQQVKVEMWPSVNLVLTAALSLTTSLLTRHFPGPEFYYSGALLL